MFMILCLSVLFLVPVHVNVKGLMRRLRVTDAPVTKPMSHVTHVCK